MNYWQVKMTSNPNEGKEYSIESVRNILHSENPYIGINDWESDTDKSCINFKKEISTGDYVLVAYKNIGVAIVKVTSDNYKKESVENGCVNRRKVKIIKLLDSKKLNLPSESSQSRTVLASGKNVDYMKKIIKEIEKDKLGNQMSETTQKLIENAKTQLTGKNQIILYGPAGTGKTYNTKSIIEAHSGVDDYETLKQEGRVQFVTFHQSFAYEDFIEGIKPVTDGGNVTYDVQDGVFKEFCQKAKENFLKSSVLKDEDIKMENEFEDKLQKLCKVIEDKLEKDGKFEITDSAYICEIEESAFRYSGDNWNHPSPPRMKFSDLDILYKNQIKSRQDIKNNNEVSGLAKQHASYFFKLFEKLNNQSIDSSHKTVEREIKKNHYLIIDEINRGNISKIFGELITLLESSKRLGEDDELTTTLPYSKEPFGIPPNLYIIGTMNTSDKSIAHLDIALRRRFGFVEMLPSYDETIIKNKACRDLLKALNNRIEILLDKDHLIGHSFFCGKTEDDIPRIMQYEIVPLLEEYFYGDFEKIEHILCSKNISKKTKKLGDYEKDIYKYWFEDESDFDIGLGDKEKDKASDAE